MDDNAKKMLELIARLESISGIVFLQHLIAESTYKKIINYEFIRWDFGPHSKQLENDINLLIDRGLVKKEKEHNKVKYSITARGFLESCLLDDCIKNDVEKIITIFNELKDLSIDDIVERTCSLLKVNEHLRGSRIL